MHDIKVWHQGRRVAVIFYTYFSQLLLCFFLICPILFLALYFYIVFYYCICVLLPSGVFNKCIVWLAEAQVGLL